MENKPAYNEDKATDLASYILSKSDGEMYVLKLMKLLYIVDREAIRRLGHPVTFDSYVSMDNGPVLSQTLDLINGFVLNEGSWHATLTSRRDKKVSIVDDCEISFDSLSEAEMEIADQVFQKYGHIPRFKLAKMTHDFEEWEDPNGSNLPIKYESILKAVGYSAEDIGQILTNLSDQKYYQQAMSCD